MSYIHFKTVYNLNFDKITFDGSSLTLGQLKKLISEKTKFVKTKKVDFELEISNADTNIVYKNEDEHIFKNSRVLVKRVVKNSAAPLRAQDKPVSQEIPTPGQTLPKPVYDSLAPLNLPSKPLMYIDEKPEQNICDDPHQDEKAKLESILMSSMTKTLSDTSIQANRFLGMKQQWPKPAGQVYQQIPQPVMNPRLIPPGYLCVICRKPGHLRQFCPEAGTLPRPEDRPKFPSGIPRTNLRPAQAGDKFAMLGPEGYVVNEIEKEAAKTVKKDKYLFDDEEEKVNESREICEIPKELKCPFGDHLIKDAVLVPCCGHFICCDSCIRVKISNEDLIECPHDKCDQEIGSFTGITPYHEIRKKANEFINESKRFKQSPVESKSQDPFLDEIMNQVEKKSPVQENKISSSELNNAKSSPKKEVPDFKPVLSQPNFSNPRPIHHSLSESSIQMNGSYNNQYVNGYPHHFRPSIQTYQNFVPQNNFQQNFNPYQNYSYNMPMQNFNGYHQNFQQYPSEPKIMPKVAEYENLDRTLDIMTEKEFNEYKEKLLNDVNNRKEIDKRDTEKVKKSKKNKSKKSRSRSRSRSRVKKSKKKNKSRSRDRERKKSRSRTRSYSRSRSRSRTKKSNKKSSRKKSISRSRTRSRTKSPFSRKDENVDKNYKKKASPDKNRYDNDESRKSGRKVLRSLSRSPSKYYDDKPKYKYK